jgi:hypothetical protein
MHFPLAWYLVSNVESEPGLESPCSAPAPTAWTDTTTPNSCLMLFLDRLPLAESLGRIRCIILQPFVDALKLIVKECSGICDPLNTLDVSLPMFFLHIRSLFSPSSNAPRPDKRALYFARLREYDLTKLLSALLGEWLPATHSRNTA